MSTVASPHAQWLQVYTGPLSNNRFTVLLFNRGIRSQEMVLDLQLLNLTKASLRDVVLQQDLGVFEHVFKANVTAHQALHLVVSP
jgi:hypothetical protein